MKNYCNLYIVRHGETEWNVKGLLQGHKDIPLNETGRKQAQELRKLLDKIKFTKSFSSDLLRAKETAEIIVLGKKIAIETTKILRERKFGKYEGRYWRVDKEYKRLIDDFQKLSQEEKYKSKPYKETESDEELMSKLIPFLREISVAYPDKNVLITTHGGTMRAFLTHLGWATYENLPPGSISNTAYVKVLCDGVDFIVKETFGFAKRPPE